MFHRLYYSTTLKHDISQNCKPPMKKPRPSRRSPHIRARAKQSARGTPHDPASETHSQQGASEATAPVRRRATSGPPHGRANSEAHSPVRQAHDPAGGTHSQQGAQRSVRAREEIKRKRNPLAAGRTAKRIRPYGCPTAPRAAATRSRADSEAHPPVETLTTGTTVYNHRHLARVLRHRAVHLNPGPPRGRGDGP